VGVPVPEMLGCCCRFAVGSEKGWDLIRVAVRRWLGRVRPVAGGQGGNVLFGLTASSQRRRLAGPGVPAGEGRTSLVLTAAAGRCG